MAEFWQQQASKLGKRLWPDLYGHWLSVAPDHLLNGLGPQEGIGELLTVKDVAKRVDPQHGLRLTAEDAPSGLREGVLLEAVYLLHKAAHVLGAAQCHLKQGMWSWSLSGGYQSAAFSMRSITMLFGAVVVEVHDGGKYLVDVWAPPTGNTKKALAAPPGVLFRLAKRADHKALWTLFLRLLEVVTVSEAVWPAQYVSQLQDFAPKDFSRQRNHLHYRATHWPQEDLHSCLAAGEFGSPERVLPGGPNLELNPDQEDFSIALGGVLLSLGIRLLRDLSRGSAVLGTELVLIENWLQGDFVMDAWRPALLN